MKCTGGVFKEQAKRRSIEVSINFDEYRGRPRVRNVRYGSSLNFLFSTDLSAYFADFLIRRSSF